MGQYYKVCNLDKEQYLDPHDCGDGAKLMEFAGSPDGMMRALAVLLVSGNNRGGGDLRSNDPIIGSWAGDRIVIAGDYDDDGKFLSETYGLSDGEDPREVIRPNLYGYAERNYKNISAKVQSALKEAGEG